MPYTVAQLAEKPTSNMFRRISVRRRQTSDGLFEPTWKDITSLVKDFGACERSIDDVKLNRFRYTGPNIRVRNDTGKFNDESNINSLWSGYLTRYNTLVRVQAGYNPTTTTDIPTDPTIGIFVMDQETPTAADTNDVDLQCSPLSSIFDGVRAADLGGINTTLTASEIIAKIRDHTDGATLSIFQQFISTLAWTIQSTTAYYNLTNTSIGEMTTWDLMSKLAESEGYVMLINRTGGLEFRDRSARTTTSAYSFKGEGNARPNVIKLQNYREALDKHFTFFRFKWAEADTSTSYVTAGTTTTVSPTNLSWKYGAKVYDMENLFVLTSTAAQSIVNTAYAALGTIGSEVTLIAKFVPNLEVLDRVDVSYYSFDLAGVTLWDVFDWDGADWAREGENFDWTALPFKVLSTKNDINKFTTTVRLRRI